MLKFCPTPPVPAIAPSAIRVLASALFFWDCVRTFTLFFTNFFTPCLAVSQSRSGAAPTSDLIKDYLVAGVTDPTNLISILAGAFTFGAGGAAIQAGKETAKQGVKKLVKTKVKNIIKDKKRG